MNTFLINNLFKIRCYTAGEAKAIAEHDDFRFYGRSLVKTIQIVTSENSSMVYDHNVGWLTWYGAEYE